MNYKLDNIRDEVSRLTGEERKALWLSFWGSAEALKCEMLHVYPGWDGMGVEQPCTELAVTASSDFVAVCKGCAKGLAGEDLLVTPYDIDLVQTCGACPEQYDAFCQGIQVGYLRLRHGSFSVRAPDYGGEVVFEGEPDGDGIFADHEREGYLDAAKKAICVWLTNNPDRLSHG
jgi:hypothetical protein